jgi:hypothetical protein
VIQDAVIRRLEIIGEAAKRVSEETRPDGEERLSPAEEPNQSYPQNLLILVPARQFNNSDAQQPSTDKLAGESMYRRIALVQRHK